MSFLSNLFGKGKEAVMYSVIVICFVLGTIIALVTVPLMAAEESYSIMRIAVDYVVTILCWLIPGILSMYLFAKNQEWLAPPGRYSPDIEYKIFSTYMLTASAIAGAVFAVGGLATGLNIDLPDLITSFTAVFFGPIPCFLGFTIGFLVRFFIGALPWLPTPLMLPAVAWLDGGSWALGSLIYWKIMRTYAKDSKGVIKAVYFVVSLLIMIALYFYGVLFTWAYVINPFSAFMGYLAFATSTWMPTAVVFIVIGSIIGESVYYSRIELMEVE